MDYLDPQKRFKQTVLLLSGYVLIAIAIAFATVILLYAAYGFGFGKNGSIIQNGLLFFSSQPNPAKIYIDGKYSGDQTNTRVELPAGVYGVKLTRSGYRNWSRTIEVNGGSVEHFDYPLLFPTKLTTKKIGTTYASPPSLISQSPNQQWLIVQRPDVSDTFDVYDLTNPTKAPTELAIPETVATKATSTESWQVISWADDNNHILLQHDYDGKIEYILADRTDPSQSVNLTQTLAADAYTQISLDNLKYNQYYLYNAADDSLQTATLTTPVATPVLSGVLDYQTYGSNTVLYVTTDGAPAGKVEVKEQVGSNSYTIQALDAGTNYVLNLTDYSGTQYVAVGAGSEDKVFIYDSPVGQLQATPNHVPVPIQVLRVTDPNYLSFSTNAQYILAENGQNFAVYDIENAHGYDYQAKLPLDSPQAHAYWMDGNRVDYVSGSKLIVFDFDYTNLQTLMPADANYPVAFDPAYDYVYSMIPSGSGTTTNLTQTSLYTAADQPSPNP